MAITNFKQRSTSRNPVNRNIVEGQIYSGTGAPALTDALVKNVNVYPIGTIYINLTAPGALYVRIAAAGVVADFSTVALTAPA